MNQGQRSGEIPGLFSTDVQANTSVDWSSDGQANNTVSDQGVNAKTQSMIMLGGKSLLTDLTVEKDNLDQGYVHSHRLLDNGMVFTLINAHHDMCLLLLAEIARVKRGGSIDMGNTNKLDPNVKQIDKIYVSLRDQKQVTLRRLVCPMLTFVLFV